MLVVEVWLGMIKKDSLVANFVKDGPARNMKLCECISEELKASMNLNHARP